MKKLERLVVRVIFICLFCFVFSACGKTADQNTEERIATKESAAAETVNNTVSVYVDSSRSDHRSVDFPDPQLSAETQLTLPLASSEDRPTDCISSLLSEDEGNSLMWDPPAHIWELNETHPIEYIRRTAREYRVTYLSEKWYYFVYYDSYGGVTRRETVHREPISLKDFQDVKVGDPAKKVMEIDKNHIYSFMAVGSSEPRESVHCTFDGYYLRFTYDKTADGSWYVTGITVELI